MFIIIYFIFYTLFACEVRGKGNIFMEIRFLELQSAESGCGGYYPPRRDYNKMLIQVNLLPFQVKFSSIKG